MTSNVASSSSQTINQERSFTFLASVFYLLLGVFSFISSSQSHSPSLELNGYYNLVSAIVGFLTIILLGRIQKGGSHKFLFGYERFIPLLTLVEGVMVFAVSQNACASATSLLFGGGTQDAIPQRTLYSAIIITLGYFVSYLAHKRHYNVTNGKLILSRILMFRIKTILGYSTATVLIFALAVLLTSTQLLPAAVHYVEPLAVFVLVSIAMKGPMSQIFGSVNQLLMGSPVKKEQDKITELMGIALRGIDPSQYLVKTTKLGETLYLNICFNLTKDGCFPFEGQELKRIEQAVSTAISDVYPIHKIEMMFAV